MKRISCFIVAVVCMICISVSFADNHTEIQGVFTGELEGKSLSIDLYNQGDETFIVSTLFPDLAIALDRSAVFSDIFFFLSSRTVTDSCQACTELIHSWLSQQSASSVNGIFSGVLFDSASSAVSCSFPLSKLLSYIQQPESIFQSPDQKHFYSLLQMLSSCLTWLQSAAGGSDLQVDCKTYDKGRYETFLIHNNDQTFMTFSIEHISDTESRMIVGYKNAGKRYSADFDYCIEQNGISITSTLWSGFIFPVYSKGSNKPLCQETLILNQKSDNKTDFDYSFYSDCLSSPLLIKGRSVLMTDETAEIQADISIGDYEDAAFSIIANVEALNRNVDFSDKQIKHLQNNSEKAEIDLEIFSALTFLAADLYPVLPVSYQNVLFPLFID